VYNGFVQRRVCYPKSVQFFSGTMTKILALIAVMGPTASQKWSLYLNCLVVTRTFGLFFHSVGNNDPNWLIFFRGAGQPPTSQSVGLKKSHLQRSGLSYSIPWTIRPKVAVFLVSLFFLYLEWRPLNALISQNSWEVLLPTFQPKGIIQKRPCENIRALQSRSL